MQADLLGDESGFDLVLANLPYVSEDDWAALEPEVRGWEPRQALVGGLLGTEAIDRLLRKVEHRVRSGGLIAAEFGMGQGERLSAVAAECFPDAEIRVRTDLEGIDRVLVIRT
jgi:release factor glutamine methyltransferase